MIVIDSVVASKILQAMNEGEADVEITTDLNLSSNRYPLAGHTVSFGEGNCLSEDQLANIARKAGRAYRVKESGFEQVQVHGNQFYKLVPTHGAPTAEIDGVKMHRSKGIDPFEDAEEKAREAVRAGDRVLDTCSGLGYTAIWSIKLGAVHVTTIEKAPEMLELRLQNPWSMGLNSPSIELQEGDAFDLIKGFPDQSFDAILHDPPRLSFAGHLYGIEFYRQMFRVMRRGGRLFHYTGNPHRVRHGPSFIRNAAKRLKEAGFNKVEVKADKLGVAASKS